MEIDNFPETPSVRIRPMIFNHSTYSMHEASAASAGSHGFMWESSVNRHPMLANLRKEGVARTDGTVIG